MNKELQNLIREALNSYTRDEVADAISLCHLGQLTRFINNDNLHLIRAYRNNVSGNVGTLIQDALDFNKGKIISRIQDHYRNLDGVMTTDGIIALKNAPSWELEALERKLETLVDDVAQAGDDGWREMFAFTGRWKVRTDQKHETNQ